jgi:hypothetical protein
MHRKYVILIISIIIVLVACAVASTAIFNELSNQRGLIFTLFRPEIQKASDDFYSEYLSENPSVANYSGEIISLKKNDKGYYIKFGIYPYLGPHDEVGYDEVEYFVDNIGTITLLNFSHKKNYDIPPSLGVTIKKPIPVS